VDTPGARLELRSGKPASEAPDPSAARRSADASLISLAGTSDTVPPATQQTETASNSEAAPRRAMVPWVGHWGQAVLGREHDGTTLGRRREPQALSATRNSPSSRLHNGTKWVRVETLCVCAKRLPRRIRRRHVNLQFAPLCELCRRLNFPRSRGFYARLHPQTSTFVFTRDSTAHGRPRPEFVCSGQRSLVDIHRH
jgi:hypothetical protein